MKVTIFPAGKGDCLLLTAEEGQQMLIDGGMKGSYRQEVQPHLDGLLNEGSLDRVCVTHIDNDHINGVVALFEGVNAEGAAVREVGGLWHNNVTDQLGELSDEVIPVLEAFRIIGEERDDFLSPAAEATIAGVREADLLSSLADRLTVPINEGFEGDLVTAETSPDDLAIGSASIQVLAPKHSELKDLREHWRKWLEEHPNYRRVGELLSSGAEGGLQDLARDPELGNIKKVTVPNLASIMFLVRDRDGTGLFTGDGHPKHILEGLQMMGHTDEKLHLNILKVPHHGSENNMDGTFCRTVTADHYIFCADGAHGNPDPRIIKTLVEARLSSGHESFTLWFNNSSSTVSEGKQRRHMAGIERDVLALAGSSGGRVNCVFRQENQPYLEVSPSL